MDDHTRYIGMHPALAAPYGTALPQEPNTKTCLSCGLKVPVQADGELQVDMPCGH